MNYYPHHIGDFNNATRHLSRTERSLYRDMIDMYYDTEQPLTLDFKLLCRKLLARDEEEVTGVQQVLNEFFTETEQGWIHARCEEVIADYREQLEKRSAAGKASAEARAAAKAASEAAKTQGSSTDAEQVLNNRSTNQEPITKNHKPVTKERAETQRATRLPADWEPGLSEIAFCATERPDLNPDEVGKRFRDHWVSVPGAKGCKLDWTATWRNWVRNERQQSKPRASPTGYESAKDRSRREAAEQLTGRKTNEQRHEIIDIDETGAYSLG